MFDPKALQQVTEAVKQGSVDALTSPEGGEAIAKAVQAGLKLDRDSKESVVMDRGALYAFLKGYATGSMPERFFKEERDKKEKPSADGDAGQPGGALGGGPAGVAPAGGGAAGGEAATGGPGLAEQQKHQEAEQKKKAEQKAKDAAAAEQARLALAGTQNKVNGFKGA